MPDERIEEPSPIIRDELARDRTMLANERTMLSYIRTGIMLGISGVTVIKLFTDSPWAQIAGWVLIVTAVVNIAFGNWRFFRMRRALIHRQQRLD